MSGFNYSDCTPYSSALSMYNVFKSRYKNMKYKLKTNNTYVVKMDDVANLPGISYRVYGSTDYWRIILEFNGLSDPLNDLYVGQVLNLPSKADILTLLSDTSNASKSTLTKVTL